MRVASMEETVLPLSKMPPSCDDCIWPGIGVYWRIRTWLRPRYPLTVPTMKLWTGLTIWALDLVMFGSYNTSMACKHMSRREFTRMVPL